MGDRTRAVAAETARALLSGVDECGVNDATHPGPETSRSPTGLGELRAGEVVERYIVHGRVGSGGMGVVYAAEDPELQRKVALKLVRADRRDRSDIEEARLLREAQAMALLSHPNIVHVYQVGSYGDGLYLAMEFVDGETLSSWLKTGERSWEAILDMFVAAARGLEAAHSAGLIHRDFKPSNVLIGDDGRPRVTDFGLVSATEELEVSITDSGSDASLIGVPLTETGALQGTPAYYPPEGYEGRFDARGDQFAFAVSLFEALFEVHPYRPGTGESYLDAFAARRPLPLPRRSPVPARIRSALGRALSLDPARRFPSMSALLDELAPRRGQKSAWIWGGLALCAGLAATAAYSAFATAPQQEGACARVGERIEERWDERSRDQLRRAFAGTGLTYAPESAERVVGALDRYAGAWTSERVQACRATRVLGTQSAELYDLKMECLDRRAEQFDAVVSVLTERPGPSTVSRAVGAVRELPAPRTCSKAERLRAALELSGAGADALAAGRSQLDRARALLGTGHYQDSLEIVERVAAAALELDVPSFSAEVLYIQGRLLIRLGRYRDAVEQLRDAAVFAGRAADDRRMAMAMSSVVYALGHQTGRAEEALELVPVVRAMVARAGDSAALRARLANSAGAVLFLSGDYRGARERFERAAELWRAAESDASPLGPEIPRVLRNAAEASRAVGDFKGASALLLEAKRGNIAALGSRHPEVGAVVLASGNLAYTMGDHHAAEEYYREALDILAGASDLYVASARNNLGEIERAAGNYGEARENYAVAVELLGTLAGAEHPYTAQAAVGLALSELGLGRREEAARVLARAQLVAASGSAHLRGFARYASSRLARAEGRTRAAHIAAEEARELLLAAGAEAKVNLAEVDAWLLTFSGSPSR